jgi:hypothetical protein
MEIILIFFLDYSNMVDEKVVLKGVKVEYVTTKTDAYENELCYFKILDKKFESKFTVKEDFKYPWFKSDKGQIILKVKTKYMKLKETTKDEIVIVEIAFKYYNMDVSEGYYVNSLV